MTKKEDQFLNEVIASVFHLKKLLQTKLVLPPDLLETLEQVKYYAILEYGKQKFEQKENI